MNALLWLIPLFIFFVVWSAGCNLFGRYLYRRLHDKRRR